MVIVVWVVRLAEPDNPSQPYTGISYLTNNPKSKPYKINLELVHKWSPHESPCKS